MIDTPRQAFAAQPACRPWPIARPSKYHYIYSAGVAELADAQDLGTNLRSLQTKGLFQNGTP